MENQGPLRSTLFDVNVSMVRGGNGGTLGQLCWPGWVGFPSVRWYRQFRAIELCCKLWTHVLCIHIYIYSVEKWLELIWFHAILHVLLEKRSFTRVYSSVSIEDIMRYMLCCEYHCLYTIDSLFLKDSRATQWWEVSRFVCYRRYDWVFLCIYIYINISKPFGIFEGYFTCSVYMY